MKKTVKNTRTKNASRAVDTKVVALVVAILLVLGGYSYMQYVQQQEIAQEMTEEIKQPVSIEDISDDVDAVDFTEIDREMARFDEEVNK